MNETPKEARLLVAKALRSGEYIQGKGRLERKLHGKVLNCCLGVACREYIKAGHSLNVTENNYTVFENCSCLLPDKVAAWLKVKQCPHADNKFWAREEFSTFRNTILSLTALNDNGMSFENIALIFEDEKGFREDYA